LVAVGANIATTRRGERAADVETAANAAALGKAGTQPEKGEFKMKIKTSIALAAAAMLSCATVAAAAGMSHSSSGSAMMAGQASDTLNLTNTQRKTAWNDLKPGATKQTMPHGYTATVGAAVPTSFKLEPIPSKTAQAIPSLRPYDFAMTGGKLLIVNPSDKKIAEVITK